MRTYEVLFVLSPQGSEEENTSLVSDLRGIAEKSGAKLTQDESWGRKRLAYPIEKFNDGIYHLFVFESEAGLSELDRRMKNMDRILRHMIVRTDLDQKRAAKLAAKNPKKERQRPMAPGSTLPTDLAGAPAAELASAGAAEAAPASPMAGEPAAETAAETGETTPAAEAVQGEAK